MAGNDLPRAIRSLPTGLSTLKRQVRGQLPLMDLRRKPVPLVPEKVAREQQHHAALDKLTDDLYFINPFSLFCNIASSDLMDKIHTGMAEYHDEPSELWHSHAWASSIRATSGAFAHYQSGMPIFPSDFVTFICGEAPCHCSQGAENQKLHTGRVYGVGRDFRSGQTGHIVIEIELVLLKSDITVQLDPPVLDYEGLLSWNFYYFVSECQIISYIPDVQLDYNFGDDRSGKGKVFAF
ncbi:hypothetical protein P152DRAFT_470402 [Eremomyces bilateralis CBS 781.70]|uniref:Uncharacterized protein n=1 Tax=Eremomyces bilateralis CBS 781.70 TaxID=1392243 RepID=A0A6G1GES4_9PEZI|nr:uncharacterized protein P152DRAFT_470402 [Eremomyces bilateralis CBS 781.70]KAF1816369.1 hypothetical protein P152DRAFT_470402 [Eremomyces bilateralis CBS 781.70]